MKTADEIRARIAELRGKLAEATKSQPSVTFSHDDIMAGIHRLQGNIGALEWAVRTDVSR